MEKWKCRYVESRQVRPRSQQRAWVLPHLHKRNWRKSRGRNRAKTWGMGRAKFWGKNRAKAGQTHVGPPKTGGGTAEVGAGSVLTIGAIAVLLAVFAGAIAVAQGLKIRGQVRMVADVNAIQVADRIINQHQEVGQACALAAANVQAQGLELTSCRENEEVVTVEVRGKVPALPGVYMCQEARAGPV